MSDIDLVLTAVNKSLSPKKVILFGSRARGDHENDSDIDLAIIQADKPRTGQRAMIYRQLINMGYNWKFDPDIHIFSEKDFNKRFKNNSFFIREIMKGKVIYAV